MPPVSTITFSCILPLLLILRLCCFASRYPQPFREAIFTVCSALLLYHEMLGACTVYLTNPSRTLT